VKVVVTADVHVHPWRTCSRDGGHDRLLDALSALRQSLDLARAERAVWVMAGDFKQPKSNWPQEALTGAHQVLREYGDVDKVMVAGNHDAEGLGGSGLAPFKDVARVVERPEVVQLGDARLLCAPWNADLADVRGLSKSSKCPVLVAHAFLAGCMLGPEDTRIAKGVPLSDYGGFPVAFFGDVHKGQWRKPGAPNRPPTWAAYDLDQHELEAKSKLPGIRRRGPWVGEVFYPGSPYQQNWGERNDGAKVVLLADLATGEVCAHPIQAPKFVHLELAEGGSVPEEALSSLGGNFVRVVGPRLSPALAEALRSVGARSLQVIVRRREASARRADVHAGMPKRKLLEGYMDARPPSADVDRARVLDAGLRLMSDA